MKNLEGRVQVYTGLGKGKTTAALGLGMRAVGHGYKVYMIQFLKPKRRYGEHKTVKKLKGFKIKSYGIKKFATKETEEKYKKLSEKAFRHATKVVKSGRYDIVILDEITLAIIKDYIQIEDVMQLIEQKPKSVELVLTGREAPKKIREKADLVTVMEEVKHPYQKGFKARKGIEY